MTLIQAGAAGAMLGSFPGIASSASLEGVATDGSLDSALKMTRMTQMTPFLIPPTYAHIGGGYRTASFASLASFAPKLALSGSGTPPAVVLHARSD